MKTIHFEHALMPEGWREGVRVGIDDGLIASLISGQAEGCESHAIGLPGLPNLHSHAFQRGMSGLAERRGPEPDTFWSWRETMYRFALAMSPDDIESVASQLYVEMLEAGFTRVGEFHYLHHAVDGSAYADRAEMASRIAAACAATGLNLTLLPVLYRHAGFGGRPAQSGQRRFVCTIEGYAALLSASRTAISFLEGANLGVAPHSLRAVTPDELRAAVAMAEGGPIHIHVAEQRREVEDCIAASGSRPVDWLLDNAPVDEAWCLVHATHMTAGETARLARRGAVVGLCPVTEANLGDGIFDGARFREHGGRFGVGSDSNVSVEAAGELRQLEYSQRLACGERNVLAAPGESTGEALFRAALSGGAAALGQTAVGLVPGATADMVSLDAAHPALCGHGTATAIDAWIFGSGKGLVDCVWTRGEKRVEAGRHRDRDAIARRFAATMAKLST